MPTPACEDIDTIWRRLDELRKEADALRNCQCRHPDDGGAVDASDCPVHKPAAANPPCGLSADDFAAEYEGYTMTRIISRVLP